MAYVVIIFTAVEIFMEAFDDTDSNEEYEFGGYEVGMMFISLMAVQFGLFQHGKGLENLKRLIL